MAIAVPATLASSAADAQAVTLSVSHYINAGKLNALRFSGTIASGVGGEYVEVVGRDCGTNFERSITSTQTVAGGSWRIENPNPDPPFNHTPVYSGATFRARWNDKYSEPSIWRLPLRPTVRKISGRRAWRVHVDPFRPPSMAGKLVELQRLSRGQWVLVRRARLVGKDDFRHEAVFSVPTRGLTLRVLLPARSAAPCFEAGASQQWRS
jgi:hypothetical protein